MAEKVIKLKLKVDAKSGQASVKGLSDQLKRLETSVSAGGIKGRFAAAAGGMVALGIASTKTSKQIDKTATSLKDLAGREIKTTDAVDKHTSGIIKFTKAQRDHLGISDKRTKQIDNQTKQIDNQTKKIDKQVSALKKYQKGLLAVGVAVSVVSYKFAKFTKDSAIMGARFETLGVVMDVVGKNAGYSAAEMNTFDLALRKTGITMTESRSSLARMAQVQLDLNQATKLGRIAQNAAVIANINSSEAFERLIYGIQSANVRVLRTLGINVVFERSYRTMAAQLNRTASSFTEAEKAIIRQNVVLEYGKRIAGAYEGAMTTAGKKLYSLVRYIDDFKVKFGTAFGPALIVLVDAATDALKEMQEEITRPEVKEALDFFAKTFAKDVAESIRNFPKHIEGIANKLQLIANIYNALPDGVVGAAGIGLIGRILFGAGPIGAMAATMYLLNVQMGKFGYGLKDASKSYGESVDAFEKIGEVLRGEKDWWTGAEKDRVKTFKIDYKKTGVDSGLNYAKEFVELNKWIDANLDAKNKFFKVSQKLEKENQENIIKLKYKGYDQSLKLLGLEETRLLEKYKNISGSREDITKYFEIKRSILTKQQTEERIKLGREEYERAIEFTNSALANDLNAIETLKQARIKGAPELEEEITAVAKEKKAAKIKEYKDREIADQKEITEKKAADHEKVLQYISTEEKNALRAINTERDAMLERTTTLEEYIAVLERSAALKTELAQKTNTETSAIQKWAATAKTSTEQWEATAIHAAEAFSSGMTDAFFEFAEGTKSAGDAFRDFAASFLKQIAKMITQALILRAIQIGIGALGGGGTTSTSALSGGGINSGANIPGYSSYLNTSYFAGAKGAVLSNGNKMMEYAKGGIVTKPTIFPMANGAGLMGEAGPEAIMPLKRGSNGKLGVESSGNNKGKDDKPVIINVNYTINAIDSKSFIDTCRRNPEAISGTFIEEIQRGNTGLRNAINIGGR